MESNALYVVEISKNGAKELPIDAAKFSDPYYRYKMYQLVVQVVGKGKMIKTAMTNLQEVASNLKVPADYIPHYFAKTIGATAKYDEKKPERERGSISGEYDMKELSDVFKKFIKAFVLCYNCSLPELQYTPVGTAAKSADSSAPGCKNIKIKCMSCGWKADVKALDLNEKFRRYILNHPPPKPTTMGKKATTEPNQKKTGGNTISSQDWFGDVSKEAVKKRMEASVPQNLIALVAAPEGKDTAFSEILKNYLTSETRKQDEIIDQIARISAQGGLDATKRTQMIVEAMFTDLKTIGAEVAKNKSIIAMYVTEPKGQQDVFLDSLEDLFLKEKNAEAKTVFQTKLKDVLYLMHNEDLLEDEAVFKWNDKQKIGTESKNLRNAVSAFVTWLKEAEEEEGSEEDEEEEEAPKAPAVRNIEAEIDDL